MRLFFFLVFTLAAGAQTANTVRYHATINDVKYVYGTAPPVAHVKPGDVIETNTLDAFGNVLKKPGDRLSMVKGDNPLTGPFYVDGAQPGDTLAVKFLDLQVDGNQGVGSLGPGFGALNQSSYTPMLHPPLPEKIWFYPIDKATPAYPVVSARSHVLAFCAPTNTISGHREQRAETTGQAKSN